MTSTTLKTQIGCRREPERPTHSATAAAAALSDSSFRNPANSMPTFPIHDRLNRALGAGIQAKISQAKIPAPRARHD